MLIKLKKTIISTQIGRYIDLVFRIFCSYIPRIQIFLSRKNAFRPDSYVFFLYGGIGDSILILPLINKISLLGKTHVLCDQKAYSLRFLLPKSVKIIVYDKKNLIFDYKKLRNQITGEYPLFVQTSPILELFLIGKLLRLSKSIGTLVDFKSIHSIGFKTDALELISKSRIENFNQIYNQIINEFKFLTLTNDHSYISAIELNRVIEDEYIVVSPMKSEEWKMGKMDINQYAKIADYFVEKFGSKVVFVGSESERQHIDSIVEITEGRGIFNFAGKTSIEDLASILIHSNFVIANDNGIAHLSAYLDLKVLVMFMFSDPEVYSWKGDNYEYIFNSNEGCMPCVSLSKYPRDNYPPICKYSLECNKSITSAHVIRKVHDLKWI